MGENKIKGNLISMDVLQLRLTLNAVHCMVRFNDLKIEINFILLRLMYDALNTFHSQH